ncbi:flavoprotein [Thermohalobacter berrensis]|uniref:Flavoprotein domain-containing protein n=1 Tax=Thermohalobacter berrensis TaxID=99594 RepID=A0A419T5Q2_9FIRM|nr:flavoprotein [Thermohalobacter berrensis]RKD32759.1 hypothetical protein BET03_10525 [Thermohalobacter berrensis]
MNYEQLVNFLVKEVLNRLQNEPKRGLVIYTGGSIGFKEANDQIKKLLRSNWDLTVLLSRGAEKLLTAELIKRKLGIDCGLTDIDIKDVNNLVNDIEIIIVPILTINTAAKIAMGIRDSLTTYIISSAIIKGIPIIAAKDSCKVGDSFSFSKAPKAYVNMIKNHLKRLEDYGIKLVRANQLYKTTINSSIRNKFAVQLEDDSSCKLNKKVITREDLIKLKNKKKKVFVRKDCIITSLAEELARDTGIEIVRKFD